MIKHYATNNPAKDIVTDLNEGQFIKSALNVRPKDDNYKLVAISPRYAEMQKQQRKVLKSSPVKIFNLLAYCLTCKKKMLITQFKHSVNGKNQKIITGKCECCGKGLTKFA